MSKTSEQHDRELEEQRLSSEQWDLLIGWVRARRGSLLDGDEYVALDRLNKKNPNTGRRPLPFVVKLSSLREAAKMARVEFKK